MSDSAYYSMRTPKRGLKTVDAREIDPHQPSAFDYRYMPLTGGSMSVKGGWFRSLMFAPFHLEETNPGMWNTIAVAVLVFLGCLVNGWVLHAAYAHALSVAGDAFIRAILIAAVSGSLFYVTQLWTYDASLQTYVYPEISMTMISTFRVGVVTAAGYGVFQFAGYAAAGGILRAIGGAVVPGVTNIATSATSYWLYWFGATVIVFSYIYNIAFRQANSEGRGGWGMARQHRRATAATALAIFAITIAFYTQGLVTFSSGQYVTGVILSGNNAATFVGDSVVPWAFWVFVALLAVPATVTVLYLVLYYLTGEIIPEISWNMYEKKRDGEMAPTEARLPENVSKRVASKIQVEY